MEKEIGKIQKGEYQGTVTEIVVGIKEYNGKVGVDIREFTQSETYTGPTKKGLRIPVDKFEEFKEIINSINSEELKSEPTQETSPPEESAQETLPKKISENEEEDSGVDENGLM